MAILYPYKNLLNQRPFVLILAERYIFYIISIIFNFLVGDKKIVMVLYSIVNDIKDLSISK